MEIIVMCIVQTIHTRKIGKKNLMPPWWVHRKTGSVATSVRSFFCGSNCVGVVPDFGNHTSPRIQPCHSLYQVPVIVLRDGVELNSFAVKLRFHRLPVYPAGVRG